MIYDVLEHSQWKIEGIKRLLAEAQPQEAQRIGGYAVYAVDATENPRPEAQTLPDRGVLKANQFDALHFGHKYSWLVRLVEWGTSWTAPLDVRRVETEASESQVAGEQVQELARLVAGPKVITADSLYGNDQFLPALVGLPDTYALVRLRSNNVLWQAPPPPTRSGRGRPAKHGPRFDLDQPPANLPVREERFELGERKVVVRAWSGLHFKHMPQIEGTAVRIEFLKKDGTPCYARPVWLFWTGPQTVNLADLCRMYLWRFAIEHTFRFLKQHLGLNANQSTDLVSTQRWMWLCVVSYWQLLLLHSQAADLRPAWYPQRSGTHLRTLTPGLVQRQAQGLLVRLGTPAAALRPAGKGWGRAQGFHPQPKPRYRVAKKGQKAAEPVVSTA